MSERAQNPDGPSHAARIGLLDAWRTLAILCMVVYHFLYDLAMFGRMSWEDFFSPGLNALQLFICCSFILLAGISSRYSHSNLKRGIVTLLCSFLVTAGALAAGELILFGILQFMAVAMLLYAAFGRYIARVPGFIALTLYPALFFLTRYWTENMVVSSRWLWPLGFRYPGFSSADYFPLLPWLFLFLLGAYFGGVLKRKGDLPFLRAKLPAPLTWPGRHSLAIYLIHQPVLYGLCMLMF